MERRGLGGRDREFVLLTHVNVLLCPRIVRRLIQGRLICEKPELGSFIVFMC